MQQSPDTLTVAAGEPQCDPQPPTLKALTALARTTGVGVILLGRDRSPCYACPTARRWLGSGELPARWQALHPPPDPLACWQWQGEVEGRPCRLTFEPHDLEDDGILVVIHPPPAEPALDRDRRDATRQRNLARLAPGLVHDLKGPLNSLGVNLEVLRQTTRRGGDPAQLRDRQERFFKTLRGELQHLEDMLQSLLSWIAPDPSQTATTLELQPLVERQRQLIMTRARHQRVTVQTHAPPRTLWVRAHPEHLGQALLNVLINALDAMPDGGRLELDVQPLEQTARVEVRDSGPGLPDERLAGGAGSPGKGGSGLAVARQLVEADGGWLEVTNRPEGGACLRLELPLADLGPRDRSG